MKVKYFAWVRERIGKSEETVEPPASVRTVEDLIACDPALLKGVADSMGTTREERQRKSAEFMAKKDKEEDPIKLFAT